MSGDTTIRGFTALVSTGDHQVASERVPGLILSEIVGPERLNMVFVPDSGEREHEFDVKQRVDGFGHFDDDGHLLMWKGPPAQKKDTYRVSFPPRMNHPVHVDYMPVCVECRKPIRLVDGTWQHE